MSYSERHALRRERETSSPPPRTGSPTAASASPQGTSPRDPLPSGRLARCAEDSSLADASFADFDFNFSSLSTLDPVLIQAYPRACSPNAPRTPLPDGPIYSAFQREVAAARDAAEGAAGTDLPPMSASMSPVAGTGRGDWRPTDSSHRLLQRALASVQQRVRVVEAERDQMRRERDYFRAATLRFPFTLASHSTPPSQAPPSAARTAPPTRPTTLRPSEWRSAAWESDGGRPPSPPCPH